MPNLYPEYNGLPVIPARSALNELMQCNMLLDDVVRVLAEGFDCYRSKRRKGTLEKCVRRGKKTLKVVVVKSFNYSLDSECWVLTHVGMF